MPKAGAKLLTWSGKLQAPPHNLNTRNTF